MESNGLPDNMLAKSALLRQHSNHMRQEQNKLKGST